VGPDHNVTSVEMAAVTLACSTGTSMAEWRTVLLAALTLSRDLNVTVAFARGFHTPAEFARAAREAYEMSRYQRLIVRSWPEGFGPKPPRNDR
jgi:hypothetical protein